MGEMIGSINYHYTRGDLDALYRIADDETVDEEDRITAKQYIEKLEERTIEDTSSLMTQEEIIEESKTEKALWRSSIKTMLESGDLEGLIDLKEGPEILDEEELEFLEDCIKNLQGKEKGKSQAE